MKLRSSKIIGLPNKKNKRQIEEMIDYNFIPEYNFITEEDSEFNFITEDMPEYNFTRLAIMAYCLGIFSVFIYSSYEFICFCDAPQTEVIHETYNFSNLLHDII